MDHGTLALGLVALIVLGSGMNAHGMRVLLRPERCEPAGWGIGLHATAWTIAAIVIWLPYNLLWAAPADQWVERGTLVLGGITAVTSIWTALLVLGPSRHIDAETGIWAELQKLRPRMRDKWENAQERVMKIGATGAGWGGLSALAWITSGDAATASIVGDTGETGTRGIENLQWAILITAATASIATAIRAEHAVRPPQSPGPADQPRTDGTGEPG